MSLIKLWGESLLGIRVHDNARSIWFSPYPEGEQVVVQAGVGNLTINIGIINLGTKTNRIWLRLMETGPYPALIDYTALTPAGQFHNFEVTTDMPNRNLALILDWWIADDGELIDEGSRVLNIYFVNPNPPPPPPDGDGGDTYNSKAECEAAGYYWYDNACHLNPKAEEEEKEIDKTTLIVGAVTVMSAVFLGVAVLKK